MSAKQPAFDIRFENPLAESPRSVDSPRSAASPRSTSSQQSSAPGSTLAAQTKKRRLAAFVKEGLLEQAVFGKRDPAVERSISKAIWTSGFGRDKDRRAFCGLLHPDTQSRFFYEILQIFAAGYTLVIVPWRLAFSEVPAPNTVAFFVDVSVDILFISDLVMNFFAYHRRPNTGQLITDRHTIAASYVRGWFLIDLLATLPVDYILMAMDDGADAETARNLRVLRILRIAKTFRFARLWQVFRQKNQTDLHKSFSQMTSPSLQIVNKMMKLIMAIVMVAHILGCLWLHVGLEWRGDGTYGSWVDTRGWYVEYSNHSDCPSQFQRSRHISTQEGGHLLVVDSSCVQLDYHRVTKLDMYFNSIYWTIVAMSSTGFGEIVPESTMEQGLAAFIIIIGSFLWAIVFAVFVETLNQINDAQNRFDSKLRRVTGMLTFLGASEEMRGEVLRFYKYKYMKTKAFETTMFDELPPRLRKQMVELRFAESLNKVPFFRGCVHETLVSICSKMQSFNADIGEYVVNENDTDRDLFILEHGAAEVVKEGISNTLRHMLDGVPEPLDYLPEGSFFGEVSFFGLRLKRAASVVTLQYSELSWIGFNDLTDVLSVDTSLKKRMEDFARLRLAVHTRQDAEISQLLDSAIDTGVESLRNNDSDSTPSQSVHLKSAQEIMDSLLAERGGLGEDDDGMHPPKTESQQIDAKLDTMLKKMDQLLSRPK